MRFPALALLILVSAFAAMASGTARAQDSSPSRNPVVRIQKADSHTLQGALHTMAKQARVAFVVEGHPYKARLPEAEVPAVPEEGLPLSEAVAAMAAAYDYEAERRGNVFLLRKRYLQPDDLPGVTPEECALSAADAARLLNPFDSGISFTRFAENPLVRTFIASLTPEQLAIMGSANLPDGKSPIFRPIETGLAVSTLGAPQQQFMRQFVFHHYAGDAVKNAVRAAGEIKRLMEGDAVFRRGDVHGVRYLGYELPKAEPPGEVVLIPLSNTERVKLKNGLVSTITREVVPDPTEPTGTGKDAAAAGPTLKEAVADLAARSTGKSGMAVEEALADKPVLLIGGGAETPVSLLRALAEIYGLRVTTDSEGALVLRRPSVRPVNDVTLLRDALRRALPLPMVRALEGALERTDAPRRKELERQHPPVPGRDDPARRAAREAMVARQVAADPWRTENAVGPIRSAAARLLRGYIEPRLTKAANGQVRLSALPLEARRAFATVLLLDYLTEIETVAIRPVPEKITRFNQLHITGGVLDNQGKRWFSLFLSLPDSDGKTLVSQGGVSSRYPEEKN